MPVSKTSDVKNIEVHFENGSTEVIEKGFVANVMKKEADGESVADIQVYFANWSGLDMYIMLEAVVMVAKEMGLFNDEEEDE